VGTAIRGVRRDGDSYYPTPIRNLGPDVGSHGFWNEGRSGPRPVIPLPLSLWA